MTARRIQLVQDSFPHVAAIAEPAAALFYERLFELDPQLRSLFRGDMRDQARKLMHMLAVAVRGLDDQEALVPAVQALGMDLSVRERKVLALLVRGLTNPEIARELIVSRSTVNFHVSSILAKLGVEGRTQAVAVALQNQLVP